MMKKLAAIAGYTASAFLALVICAAFWGLAEQAKELSWSAFNDPYLWRVLRFSLWQALLSALLACVGGILLARAWFYLQPRSLNWQLRLANLCFVCPVILVVLGCVGSFGLNGFWQHLAPFSWKIYGLPGILIAHTFLNMPLIARYCYLQYQAIPASYWRQGKQLGFSQFSYWRLIEWPMLRSRLAGLFGLVFLLCFGSFTIVLALGGGPQSTTLEVAIYQALRYDFDPLFALQCALLQLLIATSLGWLLLGREQQDSIRHQQNLTSIHQHSTLSLTWHRLIITSYYLFISSVVLGMFSPLLALSWQALPWQQWIESSLWSLNIALQSVVWVLILGSALLWQYSSNLSQNKGAKRHKGQELLASVMLLAPAMVITTGLFFLLLSRTDISRYTVPLVALINALMSLPFYMRSLKPALNDSVKQYAKLNQSLDLPALSQVRFIYWPLMRKPLSVAISLCMVLSLGDMGVIALIGSVDVTTLPLLLFQQLSSYQYALASATGLIMLLLCGVIFYLLDISLGRDNAEHI
ncbi:thiamine/thiamine pyrophosphate ABC transporter, permease protein [Agarivorans sp. OAG1]|uniref:ABC transporter permease subunit n=1 Tax=Agarivorans sp. OAG1 TaxID=3082387 RepID=UPI002B2E5F0C|nr:thiamine/thiamine pyrophosphate ABC transporter, permease protein [Agarivorans sp. OAG1]